ncbi:alpha/beta hydrolase [Planctobacterium marinum]|uniref:BD-FAE-like domain-containing protein n=1 Tax=Planctobacterium marinum TaxID=1631968 RepID=A0AA48HX13_9ALTE|nr:hypothetical protein MACH26_29590 [Planctobacterium marinum]
MKSSFYLKLIGLFFPIFFVNSDIQADESVDQVPYKTVLEYPFRQADKKLFYGEDALQFIEAWTIETGKAGSGSHNGDIIFIHGGCWLSAYDIAHSRAFTSALADTGYRVWSLEYRRTGDEEGGWPESFFDIQQAINYLQDEQGITLSETVIMGHSAGGHLALLAGQNGHRFKAVVGLAAIVDLEAYALGENSCQSATAMFMGDLPSEAPALYRAANPKSQPMPANTTLIFSQQDGIVPASQVDGVQAVQLLELQEAGHFDFIYPKSKAWQVIQDTLKSLD